MKVREYFKDRFTVDELRSLLERVGLTPHDILSNRSRPYRTLGLANQTLGDDELLRLMVEYPALIRRPLAVRGNQAVVGFNQQQLAEIAQS